MELKKAGRMKASIFMMAGLLLNVIALLPAFADGKKQDHHKARDEHYSKAEKEGEDEDDGKERNREKSRGHHKEGGGHDSEREDGDKNGKERKEKGDEVTGFIAGGLFGLANLSTLFSALSRSLTPFVGGRKSFQNALFVSIRFQQKHLRRYHYLPNIAAIAVASLHWYLSECASLSFSLQQWGMVLAILLGFSGIITKYRLAPKSLHPAIFKFHSSFLVTLAMSFLVVGGHPLMDD
jgi:hypothetical protein